MSEGSNWVEIVLLAMLAAFIGLRLVSVLGKRTGHEPVATDKFRPGPAEVSTAPPRALDDAPPRAPVRLPEGTNTDLAPALSAIADADANFDPRRFIEAATSAYRMILEAFWSGSTNAMDGLVSDEVQDNFEAAIEAREGARLSNKIISIDAATITAAAMVGQMAEITVRFVSRIAAAGVESPAETADIWTFSRHITSPDPAWLLIATDAEA
jgi:predicted lipid-binding transport protein (Tim44 family)